MLIAHLSDPHLRPEGVLYQGLVDSNAMFSDALETLARLDPRPDLVIVGGDLVDEGTPAEYALARRALAGIGLPVLAIPGNHDEREAFRAGLSGMMPLAASGPLHFDTGKRWPVRILGMDVTVPRAHHGDFSPAVEAWLEERLAEHDGRPTAILMHQPPASIGVRFIDAYDCRNGGRLAALLARHGHVERVLCGHVHRFVQMRFGGTLLTAAPSTATAIALRLAEDAEPASFVEPPAFLLHHWRADAGLLTHLVPVGTFLGPLPFF